MLCQSLIIKYQLLLKEFRKNLVHLRSMWRIRQSLLAQLMWIFHHHPVILKRFLRRNLFRIYWSNIMIFKRNETRKKFLLKKLRNPMRNLWLIVMLSMNLKLSLRTIKLRSWLMREFISRCRSVLSRRSHFHSQLPTGYYWRRESEKI